MPFTHSKAFFFLACLGFAAPGPVPAPWTNADIGGPGMAGSSTFDPATQEWAIIGGGGDIWNNADQFQYASIPVTGDCTISARVLSQGNTDGWAKAGVMVRETTAAGSTFAMSAISPGNGSIVQWRTATDAGAGYTGVSAAAVVPIYVRMNRTGNVFTGYYSTDGIAWTANGNITITMAAGVRVGLAVTAHNNGALSTCTFNNVVVTNGSGGIIWPLAPPTNLTATPGVNQAVLNWTASAGAVSYTILRSQTAGGPYAQVGTVNAPTTTFTDNSAVYPNTYFYVVTANDPAIGTSGYSNEASTSPLQPVITATPNTGLQTSEVPTSTTFAIAVNQALTAGNSITFTVTSNDATEGLVSGSGVAIGAAITFTINGPQVAGATIPITVTGVDDFVADPATPYTVSVSATSTQAVFNGVTIPNIQLVNNDNDTPGITISQTAGVFTSESGGFATFTVVLNTQPTGTVTLNLTSTNTAEGTVAPTGLTFNTTAGGPNGYNTPHLVTVTGVDDALLDFAVGYTIVTGNLASSDPNYNGINPPDVGCANLDNEAIPEPEHVWGGGGGCGLLGAEVALLIGLTALRRRRNA